MQAPSARFLAGVALLGSLHAQVTLRLLETPVQGANAPFAATGRPFGQCLFVLSAAGGPNNQLAFFDPLDLRQLAFDYTQVRFATEGVFDRAGLVRFDVPAATLTPFLTAPFFAQVLTFPGFATAVDELSNAVSVRVGTGIGTITGTVRDNADVPLANVIVTLTENVQVTARTDANGRFTLAPVRPGAQTVTVDARQVPAGANQNFTRLEVPIDVEDGVVTTFPFIVYVPRATGGTVVAPGPQPQAVQVTAPTPEGTLLLTIPQNARVTYPAGTLAGEAIQIVRVDTQRTPMPMPEDLRPKWDFAVYPPGVAFDRPSPVVLFTDEVYTPGSQWTLMRPNHATMTFEPAGTLLAQSGPQGGTMLVTTSGGVLGGGWHFAARSPTPDPVQPTRHGKDKGGDDGGCGGTSIPNGSNCSADMVDGSLSGNLHTPPFFVGGANAALTFVYESVRAQPRARLRVRGSMGPNAMRPQFLTLEGTLGGLTLTQRWYDLTSVGIGPHVIATEVDAGSLPSGEYRYDLLARSHYGPSTFAAPVSGTELIENFGDSPFGAGWTLVGQDRVTALSPARLLLSRGDGGFRVFESVSGIQPFAGDGVAGSQGDGGRAVLGHLRWPHHLASDAAGAVYFVDAGNHAIRMVDPTGVLRLVAGIPGQSGNGGDGGPALQATFNFSFVPGVFAGGLALDRARDRLYVADYANHRVRYVDLQTGRVQAFAGTGQPGFGGNNGPPLLARLQHPSALAADGLGRVWIADTDNHVVRMVTADGTRILTVAGQPLTPGYSGDGGPAWAGRLNTPTGLAADPFGTIYIADRGNNLVRRITPNGRIERYLGTGVPGPATNGANRLATNIGGPVDVATDPRGGVYVALADTNQVVAVNASDVVTVLVPAPQGTPPTSPAGVTVTADGTLLFAEPSRHQIRSLQLNVFHPASGTPDQSLRQLFDGSYVHMRGDQSTAFFDAQGRMRQLTAADGRTRTWEYTGTSDLLDRLVLQNGQAFVFTYDGSGKLSTVVDPAGRICRATVQNGNLVRWEAPGPDAQTPSVVQFAYAQGTHLLDSMTPPGAQSTTSFARNAAGQYVRAQQTGAGLGAGRTWSNQPLDGGAVPAPGSSAGTPGNPMPAGAPSDESAYVDPRQQTHHFSFDALMGWIVAYVDPLGRRTEYGRSPIGVLVQLREPGGATTDITRDSSGRVTRRALPMGRTWVYEYETPFPIPTRITDPRGNVTTLLLDPLHGKVRQLTDPTGLTTTFSYDGRGRLTSMNQPYGTGQRSTVFSYDALDRLVSVTGPLGGVNRLVYDAGGHVAQAIDAMNRPTLYTYTPAGQVATITNALNGTTRYRYDAMGLLSEAIDAKTPAGHTLFGRDGAGRLTSRTDAIGNADQFVWDDGDALVAWHTREGDTITYSHDAVGQLVQKSLGTTVLATYAYDQRGNLARADNAFARLACSFDAADRIVSENTSGSPHQPAATVAYGYDLGDNVRTLAVLGYTVTRSYDSRNLMVGAADSLGATVTLLRDALGRRTGVSRSNGVTSLWQWDPLDQITAIAHLGPGGSPVFAGWIYHRDALGNPIAIQEDRGGAFASGTHTFGYDALDRLNAATHPDPRETPELYGYDPVGNRLYGATANVDRANRLLSDGTFTYGYDRRGNLRQRVETATGATVQYEFNAEGQLVETREYLGAPTGTPLRTTDYWYDALGRRIRRRVVGSSAAEETFVYAGERIALLEDVASNTRYAIMHGEGLDEVIATTPLTLASHAWILESELWTPEATCGDDGVIRQQSLYDSFGRLAAHLGSSPRADESLFGFSGREGEASGLRFHRWRYALPSSGRFVSEDPAGAPASNLYSYAEQRPTVFCDPGGLAVTRPASFWETAERILVCWTDRFATTMNDPLTKKAESVLDVIHLYHSIYTAPRTVYHLLRGRSLKLAKYYARGPIWVQQMGMVARTVNAWTAGVGVGSLVGAVADVAVNGGCHCKLRDYYPPGWEGAQEAAGEIWSLLNELRD